TRRALELRSALAFGSYHLRRGAAHEALVVELGARLVEVLACLGEEASQTLRFRACIDESRHRHEEGQVTEQGGGGLRGRGAAGEQRYALEPCEPLDHRAVPFELLLVMRLGTLQQQRDAFRRTDVHLAPDLPYRYHDTLEPADLALGSLVCREVRGLR